MAAISTEIQTFILILINSKLPTQNLSSGADNQSNNVEA